MKILIIEDEPTTARRLEKMLGEISPEYLVCDILDSVEDSVAWFRNHTQPALVFMDIHLADGNSFEIFESVDVTCPVIFTTAYDQYAIKAFKVNSIDYLLKPIKKNELVQSLNKFKKLGLESAPAKLDFDMISKLFTEKSTPLLKRFMVKIGQTIKAVDISGVAYFFVEDKIVYAVLNSGQKYPVDFTMDYLEKNLDQERFYRINRSFIVSIESIATMLAYSKSRIKIELTPPCSSEVITSTDRSGSFKDWLSGKMH
jgi:DNA-binding LytR/AlgR family response regulator